MNPDATPNRKPIIVMSIVAGLLLVFLVWLLFRGQNITKLQASELVAANIQFVDDLNQDGDGLTFLTGSALAELDTGKTGDDYLPSQSLTDDIPFENIDRVRRGKSFTLVRSYYTPDASLLNLASQPAEGWTWFTIDRESRVSVLPLLKPSSVVDCTVVGDTVYALTTSGSQQSLVSLKLGDKQATGLVGKLSATSFVGGSEDNLLVRDYQGNISAYSIGQKAVRQIANGVGEAAYDPVSNKLVTSALSASNEDGEGGLSSSENAALTVYNLNNQPPQTINHNRPGFFVSRGFLLMPNALRRPTKLLIRDLKSGEQRDLDIDQTTTKVSNNISQMVVLKRDFSQIGVIAGQNYLQIYGTTKLVDSLPPYRLPLVQDNRTDYILDYNIGANQLNIHGYQRDGLVQNTVDLLADTCECDPNQINKKWSLAASEPGL